ncbi:hypothetical protein AUC44_12615 [Deinococcus actinosclerus]|uniref:Uncharacterized protein n=1 Tax=Deinococcus actinosclerus TaxID=1768108 RepID=A0ABM5X778_9DEIO|nr:hypothetical protein AUC44_12615 [Deinococcus actinosclerus]
MAIVKMFPTPMAADAERGSLRYGRGNLTLLGAAKRWPTPTASPWRSGRASSATLERNSRPLSEVAAQGEASGQLNPLWVEWLMGFPPGWTDLEDSATLSSPTKPS